MKKIRSLPLSLLVLVLVVGGFAFVIVDVYWSDGITVKVTDRVSGSPVSGVVVTADWRATAGHGVSTSEVMILESVTDNSGIAHLPRWGPRFDFSRGSIGSSQPTIRIFKNGYLPQIRSGIGITRGHNYEARSSLTDGPISIDIRIERSDVGPTEYAKSLDLIMGSMTLVIIGFDCAWRSMPALIRELRAAEQELTSLGVDNQLGSVWHLGNQQYCGNPVEVFED